MSFPGYFVSWFPGFLVSWFPEVLVSGCRSFLFSCFLISQCQSWFPFCWSFRNCFFWFSLGVWFLDTLVWWFSSCLFVCLVVFELLSVLVSGFCFFFCVRLIGYRVFFSFRSFSGWLLSWYIIGLVSTFKFQLRNGEDLGYSATVQIASQDLFVQTGGAVVPPILYLESFCSWFLSNHHFHFVVVYVELVEASNIKSH